MDTEQKLSRQENKLYGLGKVMSFDPSFPTTTSNIAFTALAVSFALTSTTPTMLLAPMKMDFISSHVGTAWMTVGKMWMPSMKIITFT